MNLQSEGEDSDFLLLMELKDIFGYKQCSRATTAQQTRPCCAALHGSAKLDHSEGTEQRFFAARVSATP